MKYKEIEINEDLIQVFVNDEPIELNKREYYLLHFLMTNRNKIFSRNELIEEIWNKPITEQSVDTCINRLRKAIGQARKYIVTRKGFGYGFIEQ